MINDPVQITGAHQNDPTHYGLNATSPLLLGGLSGNNGALLFNDGYDDGFHPDSNHTLAITGARRYTQDRTITLPDADGEVAIYPTQSQSVAGYVLTTDGSSVTWQQAPGTTVVSVFGRTGAVTAHTGDYTAAQVTNAVSTQSTYNDPSWITGLSGGKITGNISGNAQGITGSVLQSQVTGLSASLASKLNASVAPGSVLLGNAQGVAVGATLSGDATVNDSGVVSVGKIHGITVTGTPSDGQFLIYHSATSDYRPGTVPGVTGPTGPTVHPAMASSALESIPPKFS